MAINDYMERPEENVLLAMFETDTKDYNGNNFVLAGSPGSPVIFEEDAVIGKYMRVPTGSYLRIQNDGFAVGTGDFTFECWIWDTGFSGAGAVVSTVTRSYQGLSLISGGLRTWAGYSSTGTSFSCPTTVKNVWHHLAFVRKDGVGYSFMDGQLCESKVLTRDITSKILSVNMGTSDEVSSFSWYEARYKGLRFCNFARWIEDFTPPDPLNTTRVFAITEKYQTASGVEIQADTRQIVAGGHNFSTASPLLQGYSLVGYKIDNGPLIFANIVSIQNVIANHTVTYVYQGTGSGVTLHSVTEKYQDETGQELSPEFVRTIPEYTDYNGSAPVLDYFYCVGFKIDGGSLQQGTMASIASVDAAHTVTFVYRSALLGSSEKTPAGTVNAFAGLVSPDGWLECDGRAVARNEYGDLFAAIGELYGSGDGSTTFNLPDLRGEFIRGFDNGRGLDPDRVMGSAQKASLLTGDGNQADGSHLQSIAQDNLKEVCHWDNGQADDIFSVAWYGPVSSSVVTGDHLVVGATRPYNVAMMYCIKY